MPVIGENGQITTHKIAIPLCIELIGHYKTLLIKRLVKTIFRYYLKTNVVCDQIYTEGSEILS